MERIRSSLDSVETVFKVIEWMSQQLLSFRNSDAVSVLYLTIHGQCYFSGSASHRSIGGTSLFRLCTQVSMAIHHIGLWYAYPP